MEGPLYFNPNSPNGSRNELWIDKVLLFFKEENVRMPVRNDQGNRPVSILADGNLCETRNYLEMRQISTKINNTPVITG